MARIAKTGLFLALAMAFITLSAQLSAGQLAPSPAADCTSEVVLLFPCLGFLTNSSVTTVAPTCCGALSNVSASSPFCLCELIAPGNANATAQFNINDTRALELPALCSVNISPASCAAILGPSVAPAPLALAPASSPAPITSVPAVPSPAADCSAVTSELLSCADFLTDSASSPSSSCCKSLGGVVTSSPSCLCELAEQSGSLAVSVNSTRVTELPSLCNIKVSLSGCSSAAGPSASSGPGSSPAGSIAHRAVASNLYIVIGLCLMSLAHALLQ